MKELKQLLVIAALAAMVTTAQAQFTYTTNSGTITISGYTGSGGAVVIPSSLDGMPVVAIADSAFAYESAITSITIPSSVASIGDWAFEKCGLTNITIPDSVTNIGYAVFVSCASLTSITIPGSVASIGDWAFDSCTRLTSITIPSSVTNIGFGAFGYCESLTNLTIPGSVTNIADDAFYNCSGLTSITILSGITSIGGYVFGECHSLTSIAIPGSVASIGGDAFYNCNSLTSITIPSSVTSIGSGAFFLCGSLTSVFFQGNAPTPSNDTSVFIETHATAYYFSGATGWGATFDGIPTAVCTPPLGISIYGPKKFPMVFFPTATGTNFVLQTTADLNNGHWVTVSDGIPFSEVSSGIPISGFIITNLQPAAFFRLH